LKGGAKGVILGNMLIDGNAEVNDLGYRAELGSKE
jgi:hypothetical protein